MNETGVDGKGLIIRGHHYVLLNNLTNSTITHRLLGEELMLKPYLTFIRDETHPKDWIAKHQTEVRNWVQC